MEIAFSKHRWTKCKLMQAGKCATAGILKTFLELCLSNHISVPALTVAVTVKDLKLHTI